MSAGLEATQRPGSPAGGALWVTVGRQVSPAPCVSACVPLLDRADLAERCVARLFEVVREPASVEVVVVANGTDSAALAPLEGREDLVLVRSVVNLGFAGASNVAAELASGKYLMFLNDDSLVEEGCIESLVAAAQSDPSVGAVVCRTLSPDGSLREAGSVLWRDGSGARIGLGALGGAYGEAREVDYGSANGMLVARGAWEAAGGFDEGFHPAYCEDIDLCMALRYCGYRVVYEPAARITHLESQSTSRGYREFLMERHRRRVAQRWAAQLALHEERPRRDRERAIERAARQAAARQAAAGPRRPGSGGPPPGERSWRGPSEERALRHAVEDARAKAEYIEVLEARLSERDSYIASLPVVRAKRWLVASRAGRWFEEQLGALPPSAPPRSLLRRLLRGALPDGPAEGWRRGSPRP
jgi:GT2 family glycosyltransferase